jgi:phosphatidylglycerophosphate synthase
VDSLTIFGFFAVTAMLILYALEKRSHWFILAFALACVLASIYGFLQGVAIRSRGSRMVAGSVPPLVACAYS